MLSSKRNDFIAFNILSTIQSIIKCILPIYRETLTSWIDCFLLFNTAAELFYWKEWRPVFAATAWKTRCILTEILLQGVDKKFTFPLMRKRQNLKSSPIYSCPSGSRYIIEHYRVSDLFERSKRNQDFANIPIFNILFIFAFVPFSSFIYCIIFATSAVKIVQFIYRRSGSTSRGKPIQKRDVK